MFTFNNATMKTLALATLIGATPCLAKNAERDKGFAWTKPLAEPLKPIELKPIDLTLASEFSTSLEKPNKKPVPIDHTRRYGDVNVDGRIDVSDIMTVLSNWGACNGQAECLYSDIAPLGGDDTVNVDDLLVVLANWDA